MDQKTIQQAREWYDLFESLFEHPGWELYVRTFIADEAANLPERAFEAAQSMDELLAARALRAKLCELRDLPQTLRAQRESFEEHVTDLEEQPYGA